MLKRTKGFVSLVAAIALMLGLCSCSGKPETDPSTTADPTGIGAQAETGENTTAKDIAPESGTPETAAEEAGTAEKASTAAPTEKTTKGKNNHVNVSAAGFIWPVPGYTQLSSPYSTQYKRISIKADFGAKVVACATGKITKIYNKDDESKCFNFSSDSARNLVTTEKVNIASVFEYQAEFTGVQDTDGNPVKDRLCVDAKNPVVPDQTISSLRNIV